MHTKSKREDTLKTSHKKPANYIYLKKITKREIVGVFVNCD